MTPAPADRTGTAPYPLGVLVGLASEAAIVRRYWPWARVAVTGAQADAGDALAADLARTCTCLLSFGTAGGLSADLRAGTSVVGRSVLSVGGGRVASDPALLEFLTTRLATLRPTVGDTVGVDRAAQTPADKAALAASGAAIVDMESHRLAAAAASADRPFAILRAVLDGPETAIPAFAATAIDAAGRPRIAPILTGLVRNPTELPALLRLGQASRRAHGALQEAARLLSVGGPSRWPQRTRSAKVSDSVSATGR